MTNIIKISGLVVKNGSYYLLKTEDYEILIVCHSLQYLEKFMNETVTITGKLRKVRAFHIYAEKIELETDQLKRQVAERQAKEHQVKQENEKRNRESAAVSPGNTACQEQVDLSRYFSSLVDKLRSQNMQD